MREGYSIRAQEEKLRAYATLKDWHIYSIYADEGISAKDIDGRPEIKRLIADIISGKVTNVLVYKIDRLTRSTKNLIELIDLFGQYDCDFNSLNESIDTSTATGRMFLKIVGIFAEFERENLAERVRLGFERKAKEGDSASGFIQSFGYHREKGQKVQEIFEEEAEIVRRIFTMYLFDDYSLSQIERTLNAANIPTKKGKKWSVVTVKLVLTNPNYIGKVRYSTKDESRYFEADGKHEPLVEESTFFEVQDKLSKMKHITRTKRPKSDGYFCGILRCAACGGKYTIKRSYYEAGKPKNPGYRCVNSMHGKCADKRMISHKKVAAAFENYIANVENFTEIENVDLTDNRNHADQNKELNSIIAEIEQIQRKASEVMDLFMAHKIDFDTYQQMVKRGNGRREELEARLALLQNLQASRESRHSKQEIVENLRENWQMLNEEQRLQFFQKFVKNMVVRKEESTNARYGIVVVDGLDFNEY